MFTGFEPCNELPRSAKSKGRTDDIRAFYESGTPIARKRFESKKDVRTARSGYIAAVKNTKLPVAVHMRGNYIYLERTDKE